MGVQATIKGNNSCMYNTPLLLGLDIGSTTVKAVVLEGTRLVWQAYERHETRQAACCLAFLDRIAAAFPNRAPKDVRAFVTGSGGTAIADLIGARYIHEVNAVCRAASRRYPNARTIIELGGQDAKIVVFREDPATGRTRRIPAMNEKCAGGTGAVIDKIAAKTGLTPDALAALPYHGVRTHPVAGKCGVFAETDINSLQKQGVPPEELMASLYEALVLQNLTVLTRGQTLLPQAVLLGGPNAFLPGLRACWRQALATHWAERHVALPREASPADLAVAPPDGHFFGALGAAAWGESLLAKESGAARYVGPGPLRRHMTATEAATHRPRGVPGLLKPGETASGTFERFRVSPWQPPDPPPGNTDVFLGLDGGSTSTKAVLLTANREVIAKAYRLSCGNPIEDVKRIARDLLEQTRAWRGRFTVRGAVTTGYAKDTLQRVTGADQALVETVAHTRSGLHYFPNADVLCDVGGQDIKIIVLHNGAVKDFRLNTQCSAGNGYYLQTTAESFGVPVEEFAATAFTAANMPEFGYGCAVFMQSDIVDFQRQGWQPNEILAGLAAVLPKNIWHYVCRIPNIPALGRRFVLQGGTQRNTAAVKAQADFLTERFRASEIEPEICVHPHCGEAGAVGCALEAAAMYEESPYETAFAGFDALAALNYAARHDASTRCERCANRCERTVIEVDLGLGPARRLIIASCERGSQDEGAASFPAGEQPDRAPDLAAWSATAAFEPVDAPLVAQPLPRAPWAAKRKRAMVQRGAVRIGMPRVLNMYGAAPFFLGYFQSLGIPPKNMIWSRPTTDKLYREGATRGSVDPCFPSKLGIPHVHDLLKRHERRPLTHIFMPMVQEMPSLLDTAQRCFACPTSAATPEAVHAAFRREGDAFYAAGIRFVKTLVSLDEPQLCARQLTEDWGRDLGVSEKESRRAVEAGLRSLAAFQERLEAQGRKVLDDLETSGRIGLVLLARPYHNDAGLNHGIAEAFSRIGYPILTQDSLPRQPDIIERIFGNGTAFPLSIDDVWKNGFSENSSRKLWAAKFAARHPNLVALELSNFKCGHDAAIFSTLEGIVQSGGTPLFAFRDLDENQPAGSLRIRIETIAYFLRQYHEQLLAKRYARNEVERRLRNYENRLRALFGPAPKAVPA